MQTGQHKSRRVLYFLSLVLGATIGLAFLLLNSYVFFGPDGFVFHILLAVFSAFGGLFLLKIFSPALFRKITRYIAHDSETPPPSSSSDH
jgi:hypothetical protein